MEKVLSTLVVILGLLVVTIPTPAKEQKVLSYSSEAPNKKKDFFCLLTQMAAILFGIDKLIQQHLGLV